MTHRPRTSEHLKVTLNASNLQNLNYPGYQVIKQLVDEAVLTSNRIIDIEHNLEILNTYGNWIDVPFNAGNFTAFDTLTTGTAQTWTLTAADQLLLKYTKIGNTLFIKGVLNNTTVTLAGGALGAELRVNIPGFTYRISSVMLTRISQAGVAAVGFVYTPVDGVNYLELTSTIAGGQFVAGVNNCNISFNYIAQLL